MKQTNGDAISILADIVLAQSEEVRQLRAALGTIQKSLVECVRWMDAQAPGPYSLQPKNEMLQAILESARRALVISRR